MPLQVTPRGLSKVAKDSSHFSIWKEGKNPKEQMEKSWESPAQVPAPHKTLKDFFFLVLYACIILKKNLKHKIQTDKSGAWLKLYKNRMSVLLSSLLCFLWNNDLPYD